MRPPESWRRARVTLAIAAITTIAWLIPALLGIDDVAAIWGGFVPARIGGIQGYEGAAPVLITPFTATLVHAGLLHLTFNMLALLFCGRATENIIGGPGLLILYLSGAVVSAAAQYLVDPSATSQMVGASGAISAVIGTYALLFGRNRVKIANPNLALWVNAIWLAVAWAAIQLIIGLTFQSAGIGVAIAAHVGGFVVGLLLAKPLLLLRYRKA